MSGKSGAERAPPAGSVVAGRAPAFPNDVLRALEMGALRVLGSRCRPAALARRVRDASGESWNGAGALPDGPNVGARKRSQPTRAVAIL